MTATSVELVPFEVEFMPLLTGALDILTEQVKDEHGQLQLTDIDKIKLAENVLKENRKKSRDQVDHAREELKAIARQYEQQKASAIRSSALPSQAEHEQRMQQATADRIKKGKQNNELEQMVYRGQAELERLQQELKDEEQDAFEVSELNSEVLRLKMYRDLGFTPVEEDGIYTKVLVRSSRTHDARTVQLDALNHDFFWSNFLWDAVDR
ncbi:hypothetical protein T439DRAFT_323004 [Meredithblackwellia eburnea MCA 4105]